jgi:molybdopterin converting factor small subunit
VGVSVTVELPAVLAESAGGRRSLEVRLDGHAPTVGDLLDLLGKVHPVLVRRLRTESGQLRRYVNVYTDGRDVRDAAGTETVLAPDAVVLVLPSVAGG